MLNLTQRQKQMETIIVIIIREVNEFKIAINYKKLDVAPKTRLRSRGSQKSENTLLKF